MTTAISQIHGDTLPRQTILRTESSPTTLFKRLRSHSILAIMAATTTKAESQQLLTKADWPQWYSSVTRRAKRDKIWEYCNPDLPQEGSATASSSAATLAATTSTTASFHRELIEPIRPTARQVNPQATLLTDLTDDELKKWTLLKDNYSDRMREYNKKWKAVSELDD
jgi:hypothetical protein